MKTSIELENININLNTHLIQQQGLTQNEVNEILRLHTIKQMVFHRMRQLDPKEYTLTLRFLAQTVRQIEFQLQKHWKFEQNENMHGWFDVPHCSCPKMDNQAKLGTPYKIINTHCVIHGDA